MDRDEAREVPEVEKSINAWRQSERKVMIDTIQDLIEMSHKYARSQYTPSNQRSRWAKLGGQLIWYKDQILKSFTLEALTIEMQDLKKQKRLSPAPADTPQTRGAIRPSQTGTLRDSPDLFVEFLR